MFLDDHGFTAFEIGLVLAIASLAGFLTSPLWGYVADRSLGAERALALGAACVAVCALLFFLPGKVLVASAAVGVWIARSPLASLVDAIALDRLGRRRRADYGGLRLWMSAGWALAVLAWGGLLQAVGYGFMPALYAGAIFLFALFAVRLRADGDARVVHAELSGALSLRALMIAPALWGFLASLFLLNATFAATWNFLALRIAGLGGGAFLIAVAASLQAVGEIPAMAYTARLTALLSHRGVYVAGCAVYLGVFVSWAVIDDPLALSLIKLVIGVGFAFTYVGAVVIVDDLVPDQLRATGQGLAKAVSFGLAPVLGTLGGGLVYDVLGPAPMFLSAAAVAGLAAAIAWIAVPEARPSTVAVSSAEP